MKQLTFLLICITEIVFSAGKVSVICPTFNRPERHENLYRAFAWQTYDDKELLVFDDSLEPSPFFMALQDDRVKYIHTIKHLNLNFRYTIGLKRNYLCNKAAGEIIAHFDDDDYYAPNYLENMVEKMGDADLIKLSVWLAWREKDETLWEWDTRVVNNKHYSVSGSDKESDVCRMGGVDQNFLDGTLWGFGFSYVYRKSLWEACPFENISFGEDYSFICKARQMNKTMIHIPDSDYTTLHTLHASNTSKIYPQRKIKRSNAVKMLGETALPWMIKEAH